MPDAAGDFEASLERARLAWLREMAPHAASPRHVEFPPVPMLTDRQLENCRILPTRTRIIEQLPPGARGVELGVDRGDFSRQILSSIDVAELHLVDLDFSRLNPANGLDAQRQAGKVIFHQGDSAEIVGRFPDEHFDFVYVDANHSHAGVVRDIRASAAKVKRGGLLIFNDYTFWSPWECMPYGVMQAVNEFCMTNEERWEVAYFSLGQFMYCDLALRRRE